MSIIYSGQLILNTSEIISNPGNIYSSGSSISLNFANSQSKISWNQPTPPNTLTNSDLIAILNNQAITSGLFSVNYQLILNYQSAISSGSCNSNSTMSITFPISANYNAPAGSCFAYNNITPQTISLVTSNNQASVNGRISLSDNLSITFNNITATLLFSLSFSLPPYTGQINLCDPINNFSNFDSANCTEMISSYLTLADRGTVASAFLGEYTKLWGGSTFPNGPFGNDLLNNYYINLCKNATNPETGFSPCSSILSGVCSGGNTGICYGNTGCITYDYLSGQNPETSVLGLCGCFVYNSYVAGKLFYQNCLPTCLGQSTTETVQNGQGLCENTICALNVNIENSVIKEGENINVNCANGGICYFSPSSWEDVQNSKSTGVITGCSSCVVYTTDESGKFVSIAVDCNSRQPGGQCNPDFPTCYNQTCSNETNTCSGTGCTGDAGCPTGYICNQGSCVLPATCNSNSQCEFYQTCSNGKCLPKTCKSTLDCPYQSECTSGQCSPGSKLTNFVKAWWFWLIIGIVVLFIIIIIFVLIFKR